jgi:thioredoxin-like negative regulator of GroEL
VAEELRVVGEAELDELVAGERPVLVELQSPWCGSCKRMAPAVRSVAAELAGQVEVVLVDIDETPRLSRRFDIPGVPTTVLLVDGERVATIVGARTAPALLDEVRTWLRASARP